jgi:hypothetical protein
MSRANPEGETDAERRERILEQAFLSGAVPAVWYRHEKAAIAASADDLRVPAPDEIHERPGDEDDEGGQP